MSKNKVNYINILGKEVDLTEEQIEKFKEILGFSQIMLSDIEVGSTFKIDKYEFIVLEHSSETTAVILKNLLYTSENFGSDNNYNNSHCDHLCRDFGNTIEGILGRNSLMEHTVDLTSDDGLKDYGKIKRKMSLLTTERYRRYVEIIDKFKIDKWWWLSTAYSTTTHESESWVKCVSPRGIISYGNYVNYGGVRPFCILKSNIFVSK